MYKTISNLISLPSIFVALVVVFVIITVTILGGGSHNKASSSPLAETTSESGVTGVLDDFKIEIKKIGVVAPVIKDVDGTNKSVYNKSLKDGVAHYLGTSLPKAGSNIFIFGHSSSLIGQSGDYNEIFKDLNKLVIDDEVMITYEGEKLTYTVSEKKIVESTEVSVLNPTESEQLTLMTCWPIGTNDKRLIVIATP